MAEPSLMRLATGYINVSGDRLVTPINTTSLRSIPWNRLYRLSRIEFILSSILVISMAVERTPFVLPRRSNINRNGRLISIISRPQSYILSTHL